MLEYPDDDRSKAGMASSYLIVEGLKLFVGRLQKHLSELQRMATETLQEITDMVAREQKVRHTLGCILAILRWTDPRALAAICEHHRPTTRNHRKDSTASPCHRW